MRNAHHQVQRALLERVGTIGAGGTLVAVDDRPPGKTSAFTLTLYWFIKQRLQCPIQVA